MIIVPEMIGSTVAVYNGKIFNVVDVKAEMVGYYLGEFSITYRYVYTAQISQRQFYFIFSLQTIRGTRLACFV